MSETTTLTVKLSVRVRNTTTVKAGVAVLGLVAPLLKPVTVARLGTALLRHLRCETRVGAGLWTPFEHGLALEALSQ